jgi:hypothetical protein
MIMGQQAVTGQFALPFGKMPPVVDSDARLQKCDLFGIPGAAGPSGASGACGAYGASGALAAKFEAINEQLFTPHHFQPLLPLPFAACLPPKNDSPPAKPGLAERPGQAERAERESTDMFLCLFDGEATLAELPFPTRARVNAME